MAFFLVLALCLLAISSAYRISPPESQDYGLATCTPHGSPVGGAQLRILDAVYVEEIDILNAFCGSLALAQHYGSMSMRSVHRDRIDLRDIYAASYQVILAKPELMSRGKKGIGYELIAQYPDYGSQLVSLHGTPALSRDWMRGKVLGLLDDANSISSFQIPMAALKSADLLQEVEIMYFRTYRQLYRALFDGTVDVIPALLSEEGPTSRLQLPPGLVLEQTIEGPAWYLKRELVDGDIHCALQGALLEFSSNAPVDFFRRLRVARECSRA